MIDFFWTVSIKRYVFIDCENAENSNAEKVCDFLNEKEYISPDTQIFCFIGGDKGNSGWYETFLRKAGKLKIVHNIMPIRIYSIGDNALDNVLSVYLGMVLAHNSNAEFVILSFDHDYEPIKRHFSDAGVEIRIEKLKKSAGTKKKKAKSANENKNKNENQKVISENDEFSAIKNKILDIDKDTRPRTVKKFLKHCKNHFKADEASLNQILKDFEKDMELRLYDENKIEWLK